ATASSYPAPCRFGRSGARSSHSLLRGLHGLVLGEQRRIPEDVKRHVHLGAAALADPLAFLVLRLDPFVHWLVGGDHEEGLLRIFETAIVPLKSHRRLPLLRIGPRLDLEIHLLRERAERAARARRIRPADLP